MKFEKDGLVSYVDFIDGYWRVIKSTKRGTVIEHYLSANAAVRMLEGAGYRLMVRR